MDVIKTIYLPCGQCSGCKLERSRQWAVRNVHEASLHEHSMFLTLTYNDENLPRTKFGLNTLVHADFQKFMKRLRYYFKQPIQYYMCGEYGDKTGRAHYHALVYGVKFDDLKLVKRTDAGSFIFTSKRLDDIWSKGHCWVGNVTFESAAYVSRYLMKKINGKSHFTYLVQPEYTKMSLKRPIGKSWIEKYSQDVYPHDYVISRGFKAKPPRYYDKFMEKHFPDVMEEIKIKREYDASLRADDNTPERMLVKREILEINLNKLKRDSFI